MVRLARTFAMVTAGAPMPPHQANRDAQPWLRKSGGYLILAIDRPLEGLNDDPNIGRLNA
jgi:hypothetical protein